MTPMDMIAEAAGKGPSPCSTSTSTRSRTSTSRSSTPRPRTWIPGSLQRWNRRTTRTARRSGPPTAPTSTGSSPVSHREEFVIIFNSDVYEPKAEQKLRALREESPASRVVAALQDFARLRDDEARFLCRARIGTAQVVVKQLDSQRGIDVDSAVSLLTQMSWGGLKSFAER